jgi:uncharacterized protein
MIIYQATKTQFCNDISTNQISEIIKQEYFKKTNHRVGDSEVSSWGNSLMYMNNILNDPEIPQDAGIAIEYNIPQTSKRIDFIITGANSENKGLAVLVELKQWTTAKLTQKDGVVITRFQHGEKETSHPSYQVWSYAAMLESFSEAVYDGGIELKPCAYLHNYKSDGVINNDFYKNHIEKAPIFLQPDANKLRDFIKQHVKFGDKNKIMFQIENGNIRPSKALADNIVGMLKGNQEFIMIDEQKVVFETAIFLAKNATSERKKVLIVDGGPGTGKTVVAINLLVEIIKDRLMAKYVTKNAAPRSVYESKLKGTMTKSEISNLFTGSGSFTTTKANTFDALIVDEAHRLNEKSGLYSNMGENQIKEIINASKFSIFFIDEDQKVHWKDIGEKEEIAKRAEDLGADVEYLELASQFRCGGSNGYMAWLDNALQIRETANFNLEGLNYDFQVFSNPDELKDAIYEKNKINNKARIVAGYCWKWVSKSNKLMNDFELTPTFQAKWNLATDGALWIMAPNSVKEIGCIHTCQGLEVDYIGVIIGEDMVVRNGEVLVDPSKHPGEDKTLQGFKQMLISDPQAAKDKAKRIIKNTYRTLMTRGMKGCYIYCVDKETAEYFREMLS